MNDTGAQPFRSAQAAGGDWRTACRSCIAQLGEPAGANLGFVYASDPLTDALDLVVSELRRATGIADWVGTGGAGVCASGQEYVHEGALVVLVGRFPADACRLFDRLDDGSRLGADPAAWPVQGGAGFGVVHGDPRHDMAQEAIAHLAREQDVFLVGGLSSSASGGAVQIAKRPTEGSLSGVLITPEVPVITGISQGCSPIGPVHEVTGCRDAWVTGLDGRPALEVLKAEMGELLARQLKRIGGYIHVALPVQGSDRADYLVRNLRGLNLQQQAIAVGATLRRGDPLMFVRRDGAAAQADLRRMLGDLRARTGGRPVRGALYHVCIARGPHLFGPDSAELRIIEDALGPVPLAGFFANGEIFHDRLYAYTGVLTLFL